MPQESSPTKVPKGDGPTFLSLVLLHSDGERPHRPGLGLRLALDLLHLGAGPEQVVVSHASYLRRVGDTSCERRELTLLAGQGDEVVNLVRWLGLVEAHPRVQGTSDIEYDYVDTVEVLVRFADPSGRVVGNERGWLLLDLSPGYEGPDADRVASFFVSLLQICGLREDPLWRLLVPTPEALLGFCDGCGERVTPYRPRRVLRGPGPGEKGPAPEEESFHWCGICREVRLAPNLAVTGVVCRSCGGMVPGASRHCPACGTAA